MLQINDEYEATDYSIEELKDIRLKRIGRTIEDLSTISTGKPDSEKFENWTFNSIRTLFGGLLENIELKPNGGANQRRDIVETIAAEKGFWRRLLDDYDCRQLIFEVKNFETVGRDEFRQMLSYSTKQYGRFGILITRGSDGLLKNERNWTQEIWHEHNRLFFILPASQISLFLRKIRGAGGAKKIEKLLKKRLDTYLRSYVNLKSK